MVVEAELMWDADCCLMETVATDCTLGSTVCLIECSVFTLSVQRWDESLGYWSVLPYQTRKPLKVGNLGFKQIFDSVRVCVCVWTESKAYQLLKQSVMQTRLQNCEEEDAGDDSFSGKRYAVHLANIEQLEPSVNPGHMVSHINTIETCIFVVYR